MVLLDPDVSYMVDLVGRGDPTPKRETEQRGGRPSSPEEKQGRGGSSEDQDESFGSRDVQRPQEERKSAKKVAKVELSVNLQDCYHPHGHQIMYFIWTVVKCCNGTVLEKTMKL